MDRAYVLLLINLIFSSTGNKVGYRFKVYPVDKCPQNKTEFDTAALNMNCTENSRYLCAPNANLSNLIEFCTDTSRSLFVAGNCLRLEGTGDLNLYNCKDRFICGCPLQPFFDEELYQFPQCLNINKALQCFVADKDCGKRIYAAEADTTTDKCSCWSTDSLSVGLIVTCTVVLLVLAGAILSFCMYHKRRRKKKRMRRFSEREQPAKRALENRIEEPEISKTEEIPIEKEIPIEQSRDFLCNGEVTIYHARGIIVGCAGAGKTTLLRRLQDVRSLEELKETEQTEIVDVHVNSFEVLDDTIQGVNESEKLPIIRFSKSEIGKVENKKRKKLQGKDKNSITNENIRKLENVSSLPEMLSEQSRDTQQNSEQSRTHAQEVEEGDKITVKEIPNEEENISLSSLSEHQLEKIHDTHHKIPEQDQDEANVKYEDGIGVEQVPEEGESVPLLDSSRASSDKISVLGQTQTQSFDTTEIEQTVPAIKEGTGSTLHDTNIQPYSITQLTNYVKELLEDNNGNQRITVLDFAGQSMYYAFHQIYLSPETFYILVVDMEKGPDTTCETNENCGSRFASWTYQEYYKFWLKSIDSFSDISTAVIIVGTHAEHKSEEECKKFFDDFIESFENRKDLRRHLHSNRCFAIKFPTHGEDIEELTEIKEAICSFVKKLPYWQKTLRPIWAIFERILQQNKEKKIIFREELSNYNKALPPELQINDDEMTTLLKYLHRVGTLLYFEEEGLKDTVILDVQWFVDAFKCIIVFSVGIEKTTDMERKQFFRTGELKDADLEMIWVENKSSNEYRKYKSILMSYMEKLGLLAVCDSKPRPWYYFPCMNKRKFDIEHSILKDNEPSSILCFKFSEEEQLPIFLFYNLVIKCIKMQDWHILREEKKQYSCIFDDAACFLNQNHVVFLCICNFQIQVQVRHPENKINPAVLREIRMSLENTIGEFKNYTFEIGYKCRMGKFHNEEDTKFIPEKNFFVPGERICENCSAAVHFVDNKICWILAEMSPIQPSESISENTPKIEENNDEGAISIKHILTACIDGNIQDFLFHLKNEIGDRIKLLERPVEGGWNVLHYAAMGGNLAIFDTLLSKDIDICHRTDDQMTILQIASKFGHLNICESICKRKTFTTLVNAVSSQGKNACHYAAEGGSVPILQLLIDKGIDPKATTKDKKNIFHIACIYNQLEMCQYIANLFPSLMNAKDEDKWGAVMFAAKNGHTKILEFLKEKGVIFTDASESDRNALHIACDNGQFVACRYIAENCPSLLKTVDHKGRHAGHFAVRSGNMDTLKYLEKKMDVTNNTKSGMNILHMACLHCHSTMCEYILSTYPSLNMKVTEHGWTTAHFVAGKGNNKGNEPEIFQMLLNAKRKVDIMLLTKQGNSVLTLAIKYNNYNFAEYLFQNYPTLLCIPEVNDPRETGNNDSKMNELLDKKLLGQKTEAVFYKR